MKVRLSRDFSWWRNAFRWQRTQATLLLISYSDHASKGSTGSCLIESNLFTAAGNFDRIIEIGSFDSPLLDLFDQKQVLGQIWKKSTAAVNAVKKDGDLVWPQCQGGRKYKFQCQQITINCTPRKSPLFCTTNYLDHNCLDCGSFEVYLQLFWTIDSPAQYFMNSHGISVAHYLVKWKVLKSVRLQAVHHPTFLPKLIVAVWGGAGISLHFLRSFDKNINDTTNKYKCVCGIVGQNNIWS